MKDFIMSGRSLGFSSFYNCNCAKQHNILTAKNGKRQKYPVLKRAVLLLEMDLKK
jgi:hypothetical protein